MRPPPQGYPRIEYPVRMRAMAIEKFGGSDVLLPMDLPRPTPGDGEVLIRIVSAGVNPVDCLVREGRLAEFWPHRFPLVPGWDVAGVVDELGPGTQAVRKGDKVWGYAVKPVVQWGCYAEFVTVSESNIAPMPAKLLFEEAAAVPLAGLAAYQALFGESGRRSDGTVLVHGAAGGVGHFAVQLAREAGITVVATAGADNLGFVQGLGAARVIDHASEDFVEATRRFCPEGVDLVLDTRGGDVFRRSLSLVRPGGRLVTLVEPPDAVEAAAGDVDRDIDVGRAPRRPTRRIVTPGGHRAAAPSRSEDVPPRPRRRRPRTFAAGPRPWQTRPEPLTPRQQELEGRCSGSFFTWTWMRSTRPSRCARSRSWRAGR